MSIIAKVGGALQQVFGEIAESASQASCVIRRQRKFSACSLAKTFVLGFLQNPASSDEELAQTPIGTDGAFIFDPSAVARVPGIVLWNRILGKQILSWLYFISSFPRSRRILGQGRSPRASRAEISSTTGIKSAVPSRI